jgi:hypothetical protein
LAKSDFTTLGAAANATGRESAAEKRKSPASLLRQQRSKSKGAA